MNISMNSMRIAELEQRIRDLCIQREQDGIEIQRLRAQVTELRTELSHVQLFGGNE